LWLWGRLSLWLAWRKCERFWSKYDRIKRKRWLKSRIKVRIESRK
jgi:hypothetical protein